MNPLTQSKNTTIPPILIALTLACFALSPQAGAVCREGCNLSNANTFLGDNVLIHNIPGGGTFNTAIGQGALSSNTNGFENTATGSGALSTNTSGDRNTATGVLALADNTTGSNNTAIGFLALADNIG